MNFRKAQISVFFGILLLLASPVFAASWSNTNLLNGWTGVVSTSCSGANGCTTGAVDSSTGTLLIISVQDRIDVNPACTPTDSKSNTWTPLTAYTDTNNISHVRYWYVNSATPSVGSGHTVTCTATTAQSVIIFLVAKPSTSAPLDQQNGLGYNGLQTTFIPCASAPCLTPSQGNTLILTNITSNQTVNSIDSSFTIAENVANSGGVHFSGAVAWITQSSAASVSPTWTVASSTGDVATGIVSFKQGAGSSPAPQRLTTLGVGK